MPGIGPQRGSYQQSLKWHRNEYTEFILDVCPKYIDNIKGLIINLK